MRVPIRARITAGVRHGHARAAGAISVLAYRTMSGALLDEIDTGLRFRAAAELEGERAGAVHRVDPRLQEPGEAFEQVLTPDGRVLSATEGFPTPVLTADELAAVHGPTFLQRPVRAVVGPARLLAVPVDRSANADVSSSARR